MTSRRSFFAALFAPLLARFAPKPQLNSGVAIARAHEDEWVEVTEVFFRGADHLYRSINGGPFERMGYPYMQAPIVIVRIPDSLPWEAESRGLMPVVEMTKAEFRGRYPA